MGKIWGVGLSAPAVLLLGASFAAAADPGVRIWLRLPAKSDPKALEAAVISQGAISRLLGPAIIAKSDASPDGSIPALHYWSKRWNPEIDEEKRKTILTTLQEGWGSDIKIQEDSFKDMPVWPWGTSDTHAPWRDIPEGMRPDYASISDKITKALPEELALADRDLLYDGRKGGKGMVAVPVSGTLKSGAVPQRGEQEAKFSRMIREESARAGVSAEIVRAIIAAKTQFNPDNSGGGAYGLMLISPAAAESVGVDGSTLLDPRMNVRAGAKLLAGLMKRFNNDVDRALAGYQVGAGRARKDDVFERPDVKVFLKRFHENYEPSEPAGPGIVSKAPPGAGGDLGPLGTPFEDLIQREAAAAGVDAHIIRAIVAAKSGFNPKRSGGGAFGLMMVSPGAARAVGMAGANLFDPQTNIRVGSLLVARLLKQFNGDTHRALAAYQVGGTAVRKSGGIPNHPDVKAFLASFEKSYRQLTPDVARVSPVSPPKFPAIRQFTDLVKSFVYKDPKDKVAEYRWMAEEIGAKHEVDPRLIEAIMRRENPWGDPKRTSEAGAIGLMQLMPLTAKGLGVDPYDAYENIDGGTRHLKSLLERFFGNRVLAVAAYNAGHVPVENTGRIPNINETIIFVVQVFNNYYDLTGEDVEYESLLSAYARPVAKRAQERRERARTWD